MQQQQQQLEPIQSPRFSPQLKRLWEPLKTKRHELKALDGLDVLFIPEQQIAYIAHGNNPVNRLSASSIDSAIAAYQAQRIVPALFQDVLCQPVVNP